MPNSLALCWMDELDSLIDAPIVDPWWIAQAEGTRPGRLSPEAASPGAEMPMSNIEVEWLPVETHVVMTR